MDLTTAMQIQIQGYPNRLKSHLVGKEEGQYLIIKVPTVQEASKLFTKDKELVVRYVYQGRVFGFKAPIILHIQESVDVIFIKFPQKVEEHNLRIHKRFECSLLARLEVLTRHQNRQLRLQGIIGDLSKGGCKATISLKELEWVTEPLKIQSSVNIFLSLPGVENELTMQGTVRSMSQDNCALSLGLQFIDLSGKVQTQLEKFIDANKR